MSSPHAVYLDHAATTPMLPAAIEAVTAAMAHVGNPNSLHAAGRRANGMVEDARERIAAALGCEPAEVLFFASATLADRAVVTAFDRVRASAVEHHAVLDATHERGGSFIPVDAHGVVDVDAVAPAGSDADLVSVGWVNNEVGVVQPIPEVVAAARAAGARTHSDAVAALGVVPVDFAVSGLDFLTVSGHKIGGPMGVAATIARRGFPETPAGTPAVPLIAGLAAAVEHAVKHQPEHAERLAALRERFVARVPGEVNGASATGIVNVAFEGRRGDDLLLLLDRRGVHVSVGAACTAGVSEPSHVLLAMGRTEAEALSSLRFSFGRTTTEADVDVALAALDDVLGGAR